MSTATKQETAAVSAHEAPQAAPRPADAARNKSETHRGHVCGCMNHEGCAVCGKCIERHCVCGVTRSRRLAVCLESRACNCALEDPTDRCGLCHGCRRRPTRGPSHCRCVQHQRQLLRRHQKQVNADGEQEQECCGCFLLADKASGGRSAAEAEKEAVRDQHERLRRVKRAVGLPSSDNLYSKKIVSHLDDGMDSDLENGLDEEEDDGSDDLPPSVQDLLPRSMAKHFAGARNAPPYHPLHRADGTSLLESIEPREGDHRSLSRATSTSISTQQEILRGMANTSFELDREAALPSDDLVDFLVYMSSVKTSRVGELIGTLEDSAAVATGIVLEEYMAQLVQDAAAKKMFCSSTEATVVAFTRQVLVGFNWRLFRQEYIGQDEAMVGDLATLILQEFLAVQARKLALVPPAESEKLLLWIKSAIAVPKSTPDVNPQDKAPTTSVETSKATTEPEDGKTSSTLETEEKGPPLPPPRVRLAVKEDPVLGTPNYKLSFRDLLDDGHEVNVSVREIASKTQATATTTQLMEALKRHYRCHDKLITRRQLQNPEKPLPGDFADLFATLNKQVAKFKVSETGQEVLRKEEERKVRAAAKARKPRKIKASTLAIWERKRAELREKREKRKEKEKERAKALVLARARAAQRALAILDAKRDAEKQQSSEASTGEPSSQKQNTSSYEETKSVEEESKHDADDVGSQEAAKKDDEKQQSSEAGAAEPSSKKRNPSSDEKTKSAHEEQGKRGVGDVETRRAAKRDANNQQSLERSAAEPSKKKQKLAFDEGTRDEQEESKRDADNVASQDAEASHAPVLTSAATEQR